MSTKEKNYEEQPLKLNKRGDRRGMTKGSQEHYVKARWQPGESGNPGGRKRSRVAELLDGCLTRKQIKENTKLDDDEINAIEQIILSLDLKSLQAVAKCESTPAYMKTLAMAAILDMKNGRTKVMDLLRDRQFGAVKKNVDVTTNGMSMAQSMTPSEAREMLRQIEKDY